MLEIVIFNSCFFFEFSRIFRNGEASIFYDFVVRDDMGDDKNVGYVLEKERHRATLCKINCRHRHMAYNAEVAVNMKATRS